MSAGGIEEPPGVLPGQFRAPVSPPARGLPGFSPANRVPLVPVLTALTCLFLAAFVFQAAVADSNVVHTRTVLVGLGVICFSLYSIVSILESGTSSSG